MLGTSLIEVIGGLEKDLQVIQDQLETEQSRSKQSKQKLDSLAANQAELEGRAEEANESLDQLFEGIVIHRYRDVAPEIRMLVLAELAEWINSYREKFLDDKYLKYLGWSLNDAVPTVRKTVVEQLAVLYEDEEIMENMQLFTERFKARMIEMTQDVDATVVTECLHLMRQLYHRGRLTEGDVDSICELVYDVKKPVSHAAGQFLYAVVVQDELAKVLEELDGDDQLLRDKIVLKGLARFCAEVGRDVGPTRGILFVDAVFDLVPALKNWDAMIQLLLQENHASSEAEEEDGAADTELSPAEEQVLVWVLTASVERATGNLVLPGRPKRHPGSVQRRDYAAEAERFTIAVMKDLPKLLHKFEMEPESISELLQLLHYLHLEAYAEHRAVSSFDQALKRVSSILLKSDSCDVLQRCSSALLGIAGSDVALKGKAETLISSALDAMRTELHGFLKGGLPEADGNDVAQRNLFGVLICLRRLCSFAEGYDVSTPQLTDDLAVVLQGCTEDMSNDEIIMLAVEVTFFSHLFGILQAEADDEGRLIEQRKLFVSQLEHFLTGGSAAVQDCAFRFLCDLAIAAQPEREEDMWQAWRLSPELQEHMVTYVVETCSLSEDEVSTTFQIRALAGFCKLIMYNFVDASHMAPLFRLYGRTEANSEMIRHTLAKLRARDLTLCTDCVLLGLQEWYSDLPEDSTEGLVILKDVAKRLALTFGMDNKKIREPIVSMFTEGIQFALSGGEATLGFLEVLKEFSLKLLGQVRVRVCCTSELTAGKIIRSRFPSGD